MSLSPYSLRTGSEFLARGDLDNMMTLVFQDLVLFSIWYTTLPIFVGPYAKVLLQTVHFYQQPDQAKTLYMHDEHSVLIVAYKITVMKRTDINPEHEFTNVIRPQIDQFYCELKVTKELLKKLNCSEDELQDAFREK